MLCPACAHNNLEGEDQCASCGLDLAGLDVQAWGVSPQDPLLNMSLADIPLKKPPVLGSGDSVQAAIDLMQEMHEGCVFVSDEEKLVGVFSERDVASRVAARGKDPAATRLREVMTPRPFTLERDDALAFALHRMGVDGYRHLPVLDGGKLVGFLSMRTVLKVLAEA